MQVRSMLNSANAKNVSSLFLSEQRSASIIGLHGNYFLPLFSVVGSGCKLIYCLSRRLLFGQSSVLETNFWALYLLPALGLSVVLDCPLLFIWQKYLRISSFCCSGNSQNCSPTPELKRVNLTAIVCFQWPCFRPAVRPEILVFWW